MTTPPTFNPPCGPICGWYDGDVIRATGIPYARAVRFGRPVRAADWDEPFRATRWSPACPQAPMPFLDEVLGGGFGDLQTDEDCQHLSVTVPNDLGPGEAVPVMVWIHGGSYTAGAGDLPIMDPRPLVREQRVVVVSVTYRLGLFGFLGGSADRPANLGLLDQIEAFRWVQRNIGAFGGNPRQVTAFGQSAGGDAVAHLMATPEAASLFARAIIQSAPLGISRGRQRMNLAMARAAAVITADTPAAEVVALQSQVAKQAASFGLMSGMPFGTQYGYDPLPAEDDVDAAWRKVAPSIQILIGHTSEEARLFVTRVPALQPWLRVRFVGSLVRRAVVALGTFVVYARGARRFARRHCRAGGRAYRYVVTWHAPGNPYGAAHAVDLPLLFGDERVWKDAALVSGASWTDIHRHAIQVRQLWADFARGDDLSDHGHIPGALTYRRAGRSRRSPRCRRLHGTARS